MKEIILASLDVLLDVLLFIGLLSITYMNHKRIELNRKMIKANSDFILKIVKPLVGMYEEKNENKSKTPYNCSVEEFYGKN